MSLVLLKYTNKSYDLSVFFFFHKVVLPSLHMSLGIFKKIYDMFEAECHKIDLKLFQLRVQHADEEELMSNNFDQRVAGEFQKQQQLTTDIAEKKEELEQVEDDLPLHILQQNLPQADKVFREMANRAYTLRQEIEELVSINLCITNKQEHNFSY